MLCISLAKAVLISLNEEEKKKKKQENDDSSRKLKKTFKSQLH